MTEDDIGQWQHVFQELIQEVKPWHKWTFTIDKELLPDVLKPGWTQYQQKAFARFHCSSCSRTWASGRVLIVFHMRWCEKKAKGQVRMRVFAQRCNQCPEAPFAAPEFTWDNISRILNNLLFRILKKCYKEGFKQMGEIPLLGDTGLEGPHDSGNCEACLLGFCAQNDLGQASKPPAPPLSPTSSKSTREPKVTATCSNIPCSQSSSKVEKLQASNVSLQASNPTKDDPKVSCTSKPSTNPRSTIQQLSEVSLSALECVVQMPSPINSSRAADTANKNTRSKARKAFLSSSSYVPPTSSCILPTSSTSSSYVPPTSSRVLPTSSTSSSYVPPTSSRVLPTSSRVLPTSSRVLPTSSTSSSYVQPTSSRVLPTSSTSSSYVPPTSSRVLPTSSTSSSYVPPTSSRVLPTSSTSSSYVPPTSSRVLPTSSRVLPTSSTYVPPTSSHVLPTSSYVPPTSSLYAPPTSLHVSPTSSSRRPPENTACQVERGAQIHPESQSSCCKACCTGCGSCCRGCCECFCEVLGGCSKCFCVVFWGCCQACCNFASQSPQCCLVFLILFLLLWYLL